MPHERLRDLLTQLITQAEADAESGQTHNCQTLLASAPHLLTSPNSKVQARKIYKAALLLFQYAD